MAVFNIKQNDTLPPLVAVCRSGEASPQFDDGAGDVVVFSMRDTDDDTVTIDKAAAVIIDHETLQFNFSAAQTADEGIYEGEFQVTRVGGGIETYPNDGYITVKIISEVA